MLKRSVSVLLAIVAVTISGVSVADLNEITVTVDDKEAPPRTNKVGLWSTSSAPFGYLGHSLYSNDSKTPATFTFTSDVVSQNPGRYLVELKWTYHPNRSTNVPNRIDDDDTSPPVYTNQKDSGSGTDFVTMGEYNCTTTSCAVTVSAENGQASADAVRWTLVGPPPPKLPENCEQGEIAQFDGKEWVCAPDPMTEMVIEAIEALGEELAATEAELAACQSELAAAEDELAATEDELAATEDELAETEDELAETEDLLVGESKRYRIPRTGQKQCWTATSQDPDSPHFFGSCTLAGQDGETQAGLAPPLERFVDNDDGSVTDNFTGLVWLRNANCIGSTEPDWETALNLAAALPGTTFPLCGLGEGSSPGDWRVPNVNELMSLVDYGTSTVTGTGLPDGHPFIDFDGYYWTSTTFGLSGSFAVSFFNYPCRRKGYPDNRYRFNDAYVVNITTGEVARLPKESGPDISKRHTTNIAGGCTGLGFTDGSPKDSTYAFPTPRFIAVRNAAEN